MLLLFEKPDRHEGGEIAVAAIVAQEHFSGRQGSPFGNGIHPYGLRLFIGQFGCVELVPWDILLHVPPDLFERFE